AFGLFMPRRFRLDFAFNSRLPGRRRSRCRSKEELSEFSDPSFSRSCSTCRVRRLLAKCCTRWKVADDQLWPVVLLVKALDQAQQLWIAEADHRVVRGMVGVDD